MTLDLTPALGAIEEARLECSKIHDEVVTIDFDQGRGTRQNDPDQAVMARRLLRITAVLRAAASETEMLYWQFKGYDDPRFD